MKTTSDADFNIFLGRRPVSSASSIRIPFPPRPTAYPQSVFSPAFRDYIKAPAAPSPLIKSAEETQVTYALVNVLCSVVTVVLTLMALSVVPDCFGRVRSQFLVFLVTQILLHLALLIVSTIYVTFRLAHNDSSVIIDASLVDAVGYFVIFCVATSASFQLFASIQRYISVVWPNLYGRICTRKISLLLTLSSILFGANTLIGHCSNERTLNYDVKAHRWMFSKSFDGNLSSVIIGLACLVLGVLFVIALTPLLFHSLFSKPNVQFPLARSIRLREIRRIVFYFATDLLYFITLAYCNYRAIRQSNSHRSSQLIINCCDGLIQTYFFGILPSANAFVNFDAIRKALCFRVKLTTGSAPLPQSLSFMSANQSSVKRKYSSIPMFAGLRHQQSNSRLIDR